MLSAVVLAPTIIFDKCNYVYRIAQNFKGNAHVAAMYVCLIGMQQYYNISIYCNIHGCNTIQYIAYCNSYTL